MLGARVFGRNRVAWFVYGAWYKMWDLLVILGGLGLVWGILKKRSTKLYDFVEHDSIKFADFMELYYNSTCQSQQISCQESTLIWVTTSEAGKY